MAIRPCFRSKRDSVEPIREPLVFDVKGCSSASQASKLAKFVSLKCKDNSVFLLIRHYVTLLRHLVLIEMGVVPRKSSRFNDIAVSVIEYNTII